MKGRRLLYWLWFAASMGYGADALAPLSLYGGPDLLYADRDGDQLKLVATPAQIRRLRQSEPEDFLPLLQKCREQSVYLVTPEQEQYPEVLRLVPDAPPVLFCQGSIDLLQTGPAVAMVGSRRPSAYGRQAAREIAQGLARAGAVVVSGMADGLDSEAHRAALDAGGFTVAVMGTGHDQCYPPANASLREDICRKGLVISEIPPGSGVRRSYFALRNRIIAALSDCVCVVEARRSSGTMATARYAQNYGRPLFSVPGSIFSPLSEGTNELLAKGAVPCTGADSILRQLGLQAQPAAPAAAAPKSQLSPHAAAVLAALGPKPQGMGALAEATGLPVWQLAAALTELELAGLADQLAGRQYLLR